MKPGFTETVLRQHFVRIEHDIKRALDDMRSYREQIKLSKERIRKLCSDRADVLAVLDGCLG